MADTCKNCAYRLQTYKGWTCGRTGKRVKSTDSCQMFSKKEK